MTSPQLLNVRPLWRWVAGLGLLGGYVLLANDGRHHWHEFRSLYAATFYSMAELMHGAFDPGPAPVRTTEQVAAWFSSKLLHIFLLKQLVQVWGLGLPSFTLIKLFYAVMLVIAVGLVGMALRHLGVSAARTALIAILMLFSPLVVYLGFKLMGEVPALLFAALALALFTAPLYGSAHWLLYSSFAGIALALSALASWRVPFLFVGLWAALLLTWPAGSARQRCMWMSWVIWPVCGVSLTIGLWLLSGSWTSYVDAIMAFLAFTKPLPMWMFALFNIALVGMGLWVCALWAWRSPEASLRRFFLVWLVFSALPPLFTGWQFLEPRYLVAGMVPFAGLAGLGVEALWQRVYDWQRGYALRAGCAAILGTVLLGGTAVAQNFMPYETDAPRLIQAVRSEALPGQATVVLLPWNYTDFHLLRFLFPDAPIYLVQSAANDRGERIEDPMWTARRAAMYGDRFLPNAEALTPVAGQRLLYIGWTILPSLQNLLDVLEYVGLRRLAERFEATQFMNHMTQSWLWQHPQFVLHERTRYGQYRVYEIRPPQAASPIPVWGMFETPVINPKRYANPFDFTEIELRARFTSPSGRQIPFFGFYDGDGHGGQTGRLWKLRFMPDEAGTWTYTYRWTDGTPGGAGGFTAVDTGLPGPLRVDPHHPRWFIFANGQRFYLRGYYYSEAFTAPPAVWQADLETFLGPPWNFNFITTIFWQGRLLAQKGWNARPYNGFYPVLDGDVTRLNLSAWRHVDTVLAQMSSRRVVWYNFDGFLPNVGGDRPTNSTAEQILLRNWIARIAPYWNVTWNIAFEWAEFMSARQVNRIARYVKSIDPWQHVITVHHHGISSVPPGSEDWLDFYSIQQDAGSVGTASAANSAVANAGQRPLFAQEVVWEGEQDGKLTATQVRHGGWGVVVGAGLLNYAEQFKGHAGRAYGDGGGLPYVQIMFDFIERLPYWRMHPHNDLVNHGNFCLAEPGQEYVVYTEMGGPVLIDLSAARGRLQVHWLNPRTGQYIPAGEVPGGTLQKLTNPADDRNDWVLHLRNAS